MKSAVPVFYPGIMPGSNGDTAQFHRMVEESLELDFTVTEDIRIGSSAGPVFIKKVLEDIIPVFHGKIGFMEIDTDGFSDRYCILAIFFDRTFTFIGKVNPVPHKQAFDLFMLLLE